MRVNFVVSPYGTHIVLKTRCCCCWQARVRIALNLQVIAPFIFSQSGQHFVFRHFSYIIYVNICTYKCIYMCLCSRDIAPLMHCAHMQFKVVSRVCVQTIYYYWLCKSVHFVRLCTQTHTFALSDSMGVNCKRSRKCVNVLLCDFYYNVGLLYQKRAMTFPHIHTIFVRELI